MISIPIQSRKDATNAQRQAQWRHRQAQLHQDALAAQGLSPSPAISSLPGVARWSAQHLLVQSTLEAMRDQMQAYYDDRTLRWQESDRGQAMEERLQELDAIIQSVDSFQVN